MPGADRLSMGALARFGIPFSARAPAAQNCRRKDRRDVSFTSSLPSSVASHDLPVYFSKISLDPVPRSAPARGAKCYRKRVGVGPQPVRGRERGASSEAESRWYPGTPACRHRWTGKLAEACGSRTERCYSKARRSTALQPTPDSNWNKRNTASSKCAIRLLHSCQLKDFIFWLTFSQRLCYTDI